MRLILPLIVILSTLAFPALAQERQTCKPAAEMKGYLAHEYAESLVSQALSGDGTLLQVYRSKDTFTIVKVTAGNVPLACVVDFGADWNDQPKGQPS